MQKVTVSLEDRHVYELRARQRIDDIGSRSAAVRQLFDEYAELQQRCEDLEAEYADLRQRYAAREDRVEELESQLRKRSQIEDKIEDLPDKIRGAESYTERRQRKLDRASLPQRLKWKLTGVPVEDE
jgi:predicted RNase H-like nuclease (RuvC/YqgF family)